MNLNEVYLMECLSGMAQLPDQSVRLVLCDLPYGTTANPWDSLIDFKELWKHYKRLLQPRGAVVLTAHIPFSITVANSNPEWLKYEWIWVKGSPTGFLHAKRFPMKDHEIYSSFP